MVNINAIALSRRLVPIIMASGYLLYGIPIWLLIIIFQLPASESFNNSIELRHGVLFRKINDVRFVDEQYSFHVRIRFKKFLNIRKHIPTITEYVKDNELLKHMLSLSDKLNATIEKLFFFVYSNFEPEEINNQKSNIYTFDFTSHKDRAITSLFLRLESVVERIDCDEINGSRVDAGKDNNCVLEFEHVLLLLQAAIVDLELEMLTFMVTLTQTINSKVLSDYIVPKDEMNNIMQKLISQPFYNSFVTNPTKDNIFEIYNLCKVLNISYNTQDYSLLLKINFPLQHSHYQYMIYEVIPLYTPSKNNGNYSVRLDAWWSNSKYLAIAYDLSNFMTFSDYSCRYVKILNSIICKDYFEHMRNDVDYCVFSLYMDRPSKYCRYMFAPKPTQEFINLENGVWFYSYNLDHILQIRQLCNINKRDRRLKKNKNILPLSPNGTGIFMFDVHCHGSLVDKSYEFMSIDRDNRTGGFKNINVDIQSDLLTPTPPPVIKTDDSNSRRVTNSILFGLALSISFLYIISILCGIYIYVKKKRESFVTSRTNNSLTNHSSPNQSPLPVDLSPGNGASCHPPPLRILPAIPVLRPAVSTNPSIPTTPPPPIPLTTSNDHNVKTTTTMTNTTTANATPQEAQPVFFGENVIYEAMDGYLTMKGK